jgi:hypothetical protein
MTKAQIAVIAEELAKLDVKDVERVVVRRDSSRRSPPGVLQVALRDRWFTLDRAGVRGPCER